MVIVRLAAARSEPVTEARSVEHPQKASCPARDSF